MSERTAISLDKVPRRGRWPWEEWKAALQPGMALDITDEVSEHRDIESFRSANTTQASYRNLRFIIRKGRLYVTLRDEGAPPH